MKNTEKKLYMSPEMKIVLFNKEDILSLSTEGDVSDEDDLPID